MYRDQIPAHPVGQPVRLTDPRGHTLGWGLADEGPIAVRVMGREVPASLDLAVWLADQVRRADGVRHRVVGADTDAYRVVHGAGDGVPGLVVDRYGPVAVVRLYSAAWVVHLQAVVDAVVDLGWPEVVVRKLGVERVDAAEGVAHLAGGTLPEAVVVHESGMRLKVRPAVGQKTGMFLDQREHRALVGRWSAGRMMVNLFAYHGGFSVAAALGGAARVTTVDLAPEAIADARENFRLNGLDPDDHAFEVADVFQWSSHHPTDLLVVDPPSLARGRRSEGAAKAAYRKLHRRLGPMVVRDGLMATSSCTSRMDVPAWQDAVTDGLSGVGEWSWLWTSQGPPDHPVALAHREGAYLKFGLLRRR